MGEAPGMEESPERFDPETMPGLIAAEHLGRYRLACELASGKDVVDAACGLGYGSAMLADAGAGSVTGVDLSAETIAEASRRAGSTPGLTLVQGDLRSLPLADSSVDLACCFETIEHVERQAEAVAELRRVLRPDGVLLISSPHRLNHPEGNPHHVHELVPEEMDELLAPHFANVEIVHQHIWWASALLPDSALGPVDGDLGGSLTRARGEQDELSSASFFVALASNAPLPSPGPVATLAAPVRHAAIAATTELALENQKLRAELEALRGSRSWKLTKPLRRGES